MRIVIEIEGLEVNVTAQPGASPRIEGMAPAAASTALAEVLATAVAVGARDGGPAPVMPMTMPGTPSLPFPAMGTSAPAAFTGGSTPGVGDLSAGAAPGTTQEMAVEEIATD
jgi:hypothetical protein